jgi:hypothetical protein
MRTTGNINIYDGFNFCTTLEQSKQLLELGLNPETSDMTYLTGIRDGEEEIYGILPYKELVPDCRKGNILYKNVPAWTYYKLLTLLPKEYILFSQRSMGTNITSEDIISVNLYEGVEGLLTIIKNEAFIERINKEFLIKENNSPWISISEQLPPEGEEVLVRLKNYNYSPRIMFYRKRDKIWVEEGDVYFDCYVDGDDLWTPIPDLEG